MAEPQSDVSRPSALPTAKFLQRGTAYQSSTDQNSAEYLDAIEEEWNKRVDMEVETLVDGMADLVSLATVRHISFYPYPFWLKLSATAPRRLVTRINSV